MGTWITEEQSKKIKRALISAFGNHNVHVEEDAQYLLSAVNFSQSRGINIDALLFECEYALA